MLQNARVTAFTVSELREGKPTGEGGIFSTKLRVKSRITSRLSRAFFSLWSNTSIYHFSQDEYGKNLVVYQQVTTTKGSWNFVR